jgi:hypothetical protein
VVLFQQPHELVGGVAGRAVATWLVMTASAVCSVVTASLSNALLWLRSLESL